MSRPIVEYRNANADDIPHLVSMALRFIENSEYHKRFAKNPASIESLISRLIEGNEGLLRISERNGVITGMIGACAYLHPWSGEWIAGELFWWVEPQHRGHGIRLLRQAEQWADDKGCVRFQMIAPNDRVASVYKALGYSKLEECYQKDL